MKLSESETALIEFLRSDAVDRPEHFIITRNAENHWRVQYFANGEKLMPIDADDGSFDEARNSLNLGCQ